MAIPDRQYTEKELLEFMDRVFSLPPHICARFCFAQLEDPKVKEETNKGDKE